MKEPVYEFQKGKGWVLGVPCETRSANLGIYKFTVEARPPEPGERWHSSTYSIDKYFEYHRREWNWFYHELQSIIGVPYESYKSTSESYNVYTIKLERLT